MMKSIGLTGTCPHCGESVEIIVSKKQLKALFKGMKAGTPSQANCIAEQLLGIDKKGDLRF